MIGVTKVGPLKNFFLVDSFLSENVIFYLQTYYQKEGTYENKKNIISDSGRVCC